MQNKMITETSLHAAADWSRLPSDLLILILLHFLPLNDAIRCGAVCKEWRSAFSDAREKLRRRPWLMILQKLMIPKRKRGTNTLLYRFQFQFFSHPLHDDGRVYKIDDGIYKIDDGRVYEILPTNEFLMGYELMGSSQGWLIIGRNLDRNQIQAPPKIHMVDVHTRDLYNLPPLSDEIMTSLYIPKAVLVPCSSGRYAVACTITRKKGGLMVGQVGGDQWTIMEKPPDMSSLYLEDLNYHEGLLYSVSCKCNVLVWDLSQMSTSPKVVLGPMVKKLCSKKLYIVPASPYGLLFIARYPYKVEVFALDSKTGEWAQVRCMGKCSLFLGRNQSMCLSRSDFPEMEENGIYLTSRNPPCPQDGPNWYLNGFYNLQDGSFEHYQHVANPCAAWVIPNLK